MTELRMIAFMAASGTLFALGGTLNTDLRRVWLPVCTFYYFLLTSNSPWWRLLTACFFQSWIFSRGYGVSFDWLHRTLVAFGFAVPAIIAFRPTLWTLLTPVWFLGMYALSNSPAFEQQVPWKLVEFGTGFVISCTFLGALS